MGTNDRCNRIGPGGAQVLLTGAGTGVGETTARLFAGRGATVALVGRRVEELEGKAGEISARTHVVAADASDRTAATPAARAAIDPLDGLDVAVNPAGVARVGGRREKEKSVSLNRIADPEEETEAIWYLAMEATFGTGACTALHGHASAA